MHHTKNVSSLCWELKPCPGVVRLKIDKNSRLMNQELDKVIKTNTMNVPWTRYYVFLIAAADEVSGREWGQSQCDGVSCSNENQSEAKKQHGAQEMCFRQGNLFLVLLLKYVDTLYINAVQVSTFMCASAKQVLTLRGQSGDQFPMVLSPGFGIWGQKFFLIL